MIRAADDERQSDAVSRDTARGAQDHLRGIEQMCGDPPRRNTAPDDG
jgi:hypothetical protein